MDTKPKVLRAVMEDAQGTVGAEGAPVPAWGIWEAF